MEQKPILPNAVSTLVLGICSIVFTLIFIGLVSGIIGLAISGAGSRIYHANPSVWRGYNLLTAGRTLCIIGVSLGALYTLISIGIWVFIGTVGAMSHCGLATSFCGSCLPC